MGEPRWTDVEFCRAVQAIGEVKDRPPGREYAPIWCVGLALVGVLTDPNEWTNEDSDAYHEIHRDVERKFRRVHRRGLVDGCGCGCRGDLRLTPKGLALIGEADQ